MLGKFWSNVLNVWYVMRVVSFLAMLGFITHLSAIITFERTYGGADSDQGNAVQQTSDSGYIIAGSTRSFGAGEYDVYLIKTDSLGDTLWTKTYGGSNWDKGQSVQQTLDGGYVIAGWTQSFGAGVSDVYLIKTDASGDTVWTNVYGGPNSDEGFSVQQTSDGGYIIVGRTTSYGAGDIDVYLIKTDSSGDTLWTKTYGGTFADQGICVQETSDEGYIITGVDGSFGAGGGDVYLIKTDSLGDSLWTKWYGGGDSDRGYFVRETQDMGYIITGETSSYGAGGIDVYLIKTDASGDTIWTQMYGGSNSEAGLSVQEIQDGYIIAGRSNSFGAGELDVYMIKTDSIGDTVWTRTYGGATYDWGFSVQQALDGGYILTGYTQSFGAGSDDVYLIKTNQNGMVGVKEGQDISLQIENITLERSQPNPFRFLTTIRFQIATPDYVCLKVYDTSGRIIKTLVNEEKEAGAYSVPWHGQNEFGENVPAGVYFYELEAGDNTQIKKMIMCR